ncbi:MAG TPA: TM2 domain-containing protein [Gemmatimonadales bacterium]|nr:TM2 domain-containing protein [Gemmatimonadales bacterium]
MANEPSEKSRGVALALAVLLGPFGAHRFYAGRAESGALMACTLGGLGIWWLYDVVIVSAGELRDAEGRRITEWETQAPERRAELSADALAELHALRTEVAELAERMDFTERLLSSRAPDETRRVAPPG